MSTLTQNGARVIPANTGYALPVVCSTMATPVDATTYYIGSKNVAWQTTQATQQIYIPKAGTIKVIYIEWDAGGVAGSNENITLNVRLNNTTSTLIQTIGVASAQKIFANISVGVVVVRGDYIEIEIVCPTWITNPTNVVIGGQIYIE